jgi:hypothetical protein
LTVWHLILIHGKKGMFPQTLPLNSNAGRASIVPQEVPWKNCIS